MKNITNYKYNHFRDNNNSALEGSSKTSKKVAKFMMLLALLLFFVLSTFTILLNDGKFSTFYELDPTLQSSNTNSSYKGSLISANPRVVHYPKVENAKLQSVLSNNANYILYNLDSATSQSVDYTATEYNNKYIGVSYEYNNEINTSFHSLSGESLNADLSIFDDYLKTQIIFSTRAAAKQNPKLSDFAHSTDFALKSAEGFYKYTFTFIDDNLRITYPDIYENIDLTFDMPLSKYANHIQLDLGVEQPLETSVLSIPERYVDPSKPMIALTYDDGPASDYTTKIIDQLYKYDGAATFYMLGDRAFREDQKQIIFDVINGGNEIGAHSDSHPYLPSISAKLSPEGSAFIIGSSKKELTPKDKKVKSSLEYELNSVQNYISKITKGEYTVSTYRAPYGATDKVIQELSNSPFIYWTIDTEDWKTKDPQKIYNHVMDNVEDGDIILMHDIHKQSVDASLDLIPALKKEGYQLVTVSELFKAKGITMIPGKTYP